MSPSGFRLDLHNHSAYSSDGVLSPGALLARARARQVACLAVTDHNSVQGGLEAAALAAADPSLPRVIPGAEIFTRSGEVIGLYLREEIPARLPLDETIARIRQQGGLVYLPHPFDRLRRGSIRPGERLRAAHMADIIEVVNGRSLGPRPIRKAAALARSLGKPAGAGSDAHRAPEVGLAYVVLDEIPTRETLVELVARGHMEEGLNSREYVFNWGFQVMAPVTRFRRKVLPFGS